MTSPNPWDAITPADEQDAMHQISQMMVGTKALQNEPGVVYSLAAAQAHPADAQAIDQFMQSLELEKQVRLASATGHKLILNDTQRSLLDSTGVDYQGVAWTQQDATNAAANRIFKESNGTLQAKKDANGNLILDNQGRILTEPVPPKPEHHDTGYGTGFLGLGPLWHDVNNDVIKPIGRDVVSPAVSGLSKGYNYVATDVSDYYHHLLNTGGDIASSQAGAQANGADIKSPDQRMSDSRRQEMVSAGYDPTNPMSVAAFMASGKAHSDLTPIADQIDAENPQGVLGWNGQQWVAETEKFLNDPNGYQKQVESDPANYTQVGTQTVLTPQGQLAIDRLKSPQFANVLAQVRGHAATLGNDIANGVGLDAVNHPTAHAIFAAGTDLAMAFAVDPVNMLGNAYKVAKVAQVGIDSLGDAQTAAKILDPNVSTGFFARQVQRGWNRAIELSSGIRKARAAGDSATENALTAKFQAELPGLRPMMDDFIGSHMLTDPKNWERTYRDGKPIVNPTYEAGPGINSLADAAEYVSSRYAMIRLMQGRAAVQSSLMPGMLSAFGYRKLRGLTAGWLSARATAKSEDAFASAVSRLEADPALREEWIKRGDLEKFLPEADDAVHVETGNPIVDKEFVNFHDDIRRVAGVLNDRKLAKTADLNQLSGELDDLEARLQHLMDNYKHADPQELASLTDAISQGRALVEMHKGMSLEADTLIAKDAAAVAQENAPRAGQQFGNAPISKEPSVEGFNARTAPKVGYTLTPAGKGTVAYNLRRTGDALGQGHGLGWASPTAIAARSRMAMTRLGTLLPRNTMFDLNDASTGEKVYKYARLYLNRGDSNALLAQWNSATAGERKAILNGLWDQVSHAAGLGRTESGRKILDAAKTQTEAYHSLGDEIILNGQNVALHAGQTRQVWTLPSFQALHQAASHFGLWEATMGRALTSHMADMMMSQWKLGALFKPNTVTRNQLEGWLRTALEGQFGDAVKAKAVLTTPNRELWKYGLSADTKKEYEALIAAGKADEAERLARSGMLSGEILGRSTPTSKLAEFAPIALAARAYRSVFFKHMDEARVEAMLTLGKDELAQAMEEYGQQIRQADLGTRNVARQSSEVAAAGFGPAKIRYAVRRAMRRGDKNTDKVTRYVPMTLEGQLGADRYEHALAMRVNPTPSIARAVVKELEKEAKTGEPVDIEKIVAAMDAPEVAQQMKLLAYGRIGWADAQGVGPARWAINDEDALLGKRIFASKVVEDYRHLLTGQNQQFQKQLAKYIRTRGEAPNSDWIQRNLRGDNRPETAIAEDVMAMPNGGSSSTWSALQDLQGGAYEWMVERPLLRTTSSPVFLANYAEARHGLNPMVDALVEQGLDREAVENLAKELSIKNAWVKTEQLIDDPGQKTQFDIVARNMFPFSRATQAMIRRWGAGLWQDPTRARKMMLAYEAAQHSGFVYTNQYGEPTFTYPASGAMNFAMREIGKIPGFEAWGRFPISASMTGGVLLSVPGADNPLRMSMGPMLTIPLREVEKWFPDKKQMFDQIDSLINGPIGSGQTFSQLVPGVIHKFYTAMDENSRDSALASAMKGALANLAAAGLIPKQDATKDQIDAFIQRVKTQVRNQLLFRAVFGLFAPAPPSSPSEGTSASQADYTFKLQGIGQLSDEYKQILNQVGGDSARAHAIFTAMHPDLYIWKNGQPISKTLPSAEMESQSQSLTPKAYLPSTTASLDWMEKNLPFIHKYNAVAAYFLPMSASQGTFNDQSYKTQLELDLRQRKTPQEFYDQVRLRNAEAVYYPTVDGFQARIAAAQKAGDTQAVNIWMGARHQWETDFKNANPILKGKLDAYPDARAVAEDQLRELKNMLKAGEVPDGNAGLLGQLVANYDGYVAFTNQHRGQDTNSRALRDAALQAFNTWASQNVAGSELADLYAGVFRTLNTNLVDLSATLGS